MGTADVWSAPKSYCSPCEAPRMQISGWYSDQKCTKQREAVEALVSSGRLKTEVFLRRFRQEMSAIATAAPAAMDTADKYCAGSSSAPKSYSSPCEAPGRQICGWYSDQKCAKQREALEALVASGRFKSEVFLRRFRQEMSAAAPV